MFTKIVSKEAKYLKYSVVSLLACFGIAGSNIAIAKPHANLHHANLHQVKLHKTNLNQVNIKTVNVEQIKSSSLQIFKLKPRVNVWGFTGDRTLAETQILFPLKGDNNKVLYAIAEGNYTKNDSSWMAGFGFGYRQIVDGKILGGYAIADYFNTSENEFVIANPGIEVLGFHDAWDFSLNGYIPLDKHKKVGQEGWAGDDFENYSYGRAIGHKFYDHKFQEFEEVGTGLDVEIGRTLPWFANNAKLYLGGYHFDTKDSGAINGVSTRFTYDLNKYTTLELENSYDNLHKNKFLVGVRFSLGGYSQEEKQQFGLSTRLLDPRNHGMYRLLVKNNLVDTGEQLQHDNVWYFKQGEVNNYSLPEGSGTAEDPLINFTPANYAIVYANKNTGVIDAHPLMYFAPGEYSFTSFSTFHGTTEYQNRFALENGWGMYGRSSDYRAKANADERASFAGGLDMNYNKGFGNKATTLSSIMIYNAESGADNATLYIQNADNVIFDNVFISNELDTTYIGSVFAIYAELSTLNFNKGTNSIYAFEGASAHGIYAYSSKLNFNNGTNVIEAFSDMSNAIYATDSVVNFNGGNNIIQAISDTNNAYGVYVTQLSTLNFYNGNNYITSSSSDKDSYGIGVFAGSIMSFHDGVNYVNSFSKFGDSYGLYLVGDSIANFSNGINTLDSASESGDTFGIYAYEYSGVNFNGGVNTVNSSSEIEDSFGLYLTDYSIANFYDGINTLVSSSESGDAFGIYAYEGSYINFDGGNNTITSSTDHTSASGIYIGGQSAVNFNDGINKVEVSSSDVANGIMAENSLINFNSGTNTINATSAISDGIYLRWSVLNFNGGTNTIKATSFGDNNEEANGIYDDAGSLINFNNGNNRIDSFSFDGDSYGVYTEASSVLNFNGGINTIKSYSSSDNYSYGIFINDNSILNFNANSLLNIDVGGSNDIVGIYADDDCSINCWNGIAYEAFTADNIGNITNYVNFTKEGSGSSNSKKVDWDDIELNW